MHSHTRALTPIAAAVVVTSALFFSSVASAQIATVNGVVIPQARMDAVLKILAANKQPDTPENRARVKEQLINNEVFSQEAVKKGLQKSPEIAAQLELQRQETLVNAFVQDYMKANPVTDDAMRKEFERIKPTIPAKEYKARHILVEKEDEAKDVIAQVKKGGSFENWQRKSRKTLARKRAVVISIGALPTAMSNPSAKRS